MKQWMKKVGAGLVAPMCITAGLFGMSWANKDESRLGEFKFIKPKVIKTLTSDVFGSSQEFDFNKNVVMFIDHAASVGRGSVGVITTKRLFNFDELPDTTNLHIARKMIENGATSAKLVHTGIYTEEKQQNKYPRYRESTYAVYNY